MGKERLIVVVPAMNSRVEKWQPLVERLKREPGCTAAEAEWYLHDQRTHGLGLKRLANLSTALVTAIQGKWVENGGFEEIWLLGHSLGGLVARQAYMIGRGAEPGATQTHDWARAVTRIVLLAAPNRGVEKLPWHVRPLDWFLRIVPPFYNIPFTYRDLMRGSSFVTNLRINWIRFFGVATRRGERLPTVVQVLGTADSIVEESDSLDVMAFPNSLAFSIEGADHDEVQLLGKTPGAEARYRVLKGAILGDDLGVRPVERMTTVDTHRHVLFIYHGIRARRTDDWLERAEVAARAAYPDGVRTQRPEYGRVTARGFAMPGVRLRYIRYLQDHYTEELAQNPHAEFDFLGHSNGTFMLGESLKRIPGMCFRHVLVAGSVLPEDYAWDVAKRKKQVQEVRSDRGQKDWPVGWLCSALRHGLWMKDVGTGGYDGFTKGSVHEEKYHPGGHGGMFNDANIQRMAQFLATGESGPEPANLCAELQWWGFVSRLLRYVPPLLIVGFVVALILLPTLTGKLILLLGVLIIYVLLNII
jgi:pimeloyl-ACP methyl ester carboxylesterase